LSPWSVLIEQLADLLPGLQKTPSAGQALDEHDRHLGVRIIPRLTG